MLSVVGEHAVWDRLVVADLDSQRLHRFCFGEAAQIASLRADGDSDIVREVDDATILSSEKLWNALRIEKIAITRHEDTMLLSCK